MDEEISQFVSITSSTPEQARFFLESSNGDLQTAMDSFFESGGEMDGDADPEDPEVDVPVPQAPVAQAPRAAVPPAKRASNRPPPSAAHGNVRGLSDYRNDAAESDDEDNEYYTGGAKSGMMVQDPNSKKSAKNADEAQVEALFEKARQYVAQPGDEEFEDSAPRASAFSGVGRTLAGPPPEEAPLLPAAAAEPPRPRVHTVCFYNNGFTVDDGPLRRQEDDPANGEFITSIQNGECPKELEPPKGQPRSPHPVRVNLTRREEDWVAPPTPKYLAFSGGGRTLGSDAASTSAAPPLTPPPPSRNEITVNEAEPLTTLQLRLHDGTRMTARFNHSHTVGDIFQFIRSSRSDSPANFQLMASFPPTPLTDYSKTLKDAGLVGAVVIQKL
mmetsp:Transcript_24880/g.41596  ORF Transcript_24880/g.41596 Transcript_24880/m.41596 type:complete len:387 (-) Transcript_24880:335-1495(-)|eukprot:CAMPEP_0198213424 /NCGR_PEP_ID=MMETSP1445-20131203/28858_1 /TAXON_ID=36898 /ORGANISM="Pyramimonas sp., Strain CCMP2087" /LENGTH=386 /DNA_ID=CAMNT_0043888065 /DNA_START=72 /DNA_END=1232 /DNA_ORIENTATION=-